MRVAVVQLNAQDVVEENLARVHHWIAQAAAAGAKLVSLPDKFAFFGEEAQKRDIAERLDGAFPGPILSALIASATKHGVWVVGGGMPERSADVARPYNTSVLVDPKGGVAEPVTAEVLGVGLGMTVCYDVRFPELYRKLVDQGARIVTVPAAFTLTTGKDHWHVLLRARAIENQMYLMAPAQHGKHPRGRHTFGKSLIVDPWGEVIAQCSEGEGFASAEIDFAYQDRVRAALPSLLHRKW